MRRRDAGSGRQMAGFFGTRLTRFGVVLCVTLLSACASPQAARHAAALDPDVPCTRSDFKDNSADFHFVIVSDNTEGHREGVLRRALEEADTLAPDFIINIGDLIEGYTEDRAELATQWGEIDSAVEELDTPFFFVCGNHDMGNDVMLDVWRTRHGRDYYHFVYKDVLFLALSTEDPPLPVTKETEADVAKLRELLSRDRDKAYQMLMQNENVQKAILYPKISDEQVEYFRQVLADHPHVRWTFVLMHKPAWKYGTENFRKIESLMQERNYTVFAGHEHYYEYSRINGRDYIQLGATGGHFVQEGPGAFDHIVWVSMTADGPKIGNLLLDGYRDGTGKPLE